MMRLLRGWCVSSVCLTALLLASGCEEGDGADQVAQSPPGAGGGMPGGGGTVSPGIKQIMTKLAKGPNALTPVIGNELGKNPPPWETIQGQTKEFSQSASELGKYDPPKGAKESWIKLTTAFAESAAELDQAAKAKNKETAMVAHDQLKNSCNACHQQHRGMGGAGRGGPPALGPRGGPGGPPPA
jgi:Cytochrome C'